MFIRRVSYSSPGVFIGISGISVHKFDLNFNFWEYLFSVIVISLAESFSRDYFDTAQTEAHEKSSNISRAKHKLYYLSPSFVK